jgi:hypothetical protein
VLVRPDRHVAWRAARWSEDGSTELAAVFDSILRLPAMSTTSP